MDEQKRGIFSKSERKQDLEYFCTIGVGLGIFCPERVKFDSKVFCPKRKVKRNWTKNNFVQESKRENGSKVRQARRGVRSPVR